MGLGIISISTNSYAGGWGYTGLNSMALIKYKCDPKKLSCKIWLWICKIAVSLTEKLKNNNYHDDVIKWKYFPRYWPFARGIHRWPVNSPHKVQWRGALMLSLICTLYRRLSKQSWGWWFETLSHSEWRHCNGVDTGEIGIIITVKSLDRHRASNHQHLNFWSTTFRANLQSSALLAFYEGNLPLTGWWKPGSDI